MSDLRHSHGYACTVYSIILYYVYVYHMTVEDYVWNRITEQCHIYDYHYG